MSIGALVVLGSGMYITLNRKDLFVYALAALLIGFTMVQVGIFMGNRYGRSPRPDEKLDTGLKGLQNEFVMYHYMTPVSHLLVGPAGIWVLKPYHQRGRVTYTRNRWRNSGGGFLQGYLRIFGQESLGRPDLEVESDVNAIRKHIKKAFGDENVPEVEAMMVFTSEDVEIDAPDAPLQAMKLKQIKEFFRKRAKEKKMSRDLLNRLYSIFG